MTLYQYGPGNGTIPAPPPPTESYTVAGAPPARSPMADLAETGSDLTGLAGFGILVLLVGIGLSRLRAAKR